MKLSITKAWDETSAFVKAEAGTLFLIAFALMALPGLILQVFAQSFMLANFAITPGSPPDLGPLLAALPTLLLLLIPVILLSMWGHLTINMLALRRETVVGSAFAHAARRILPLIGAWLLWVIAVMIVLVPVAALVVGAARSGHAGLPVLLMLVVVLAMIFVSIRLLLTTPVAAAETVGPVGILRRAWLLTAGHFWRLLGFIFLIFIAFFVLILVVSIVTGVVVTLIAGPPLPGTVSYFIVQLIMGVLRAVFLTYFVVMVARIYAQLSGDAGSVAGVFE